MKYKLYLALLLGLCLFQCKEKKDIAPSTGEIKEIDVIDFSVPEIDPRNIIIGKDVIVINLPENYTGGDFIKPYIRLGTEYTINSDLVDGFSFEGKKISLQLESIKFGSRTYTICVVPFNPVKLPEPVKDYKITIGPDAGITVPIFLTGTLTAVNDSGKIVDTPTVILTDKATSTNYQSFLTDISNVGGVKRLTVHFPASVQPDEYKADIVWGTKRELLSNHISILAGSLQLQKVSWYMLPNSKYFTIPGYNILKDHKYELIIENDFIEKHKIGLSYKDAATLEGNIPEDVPTGNYKVTYLDNGKKIEAIDYPNWIENYISFDNFYIRRYTSQPILKIISQPSASNSFPTGMGYSLHYYEPVVNISRNEPIIANIQRFYTPFPAKNDLVLINVNTRKEYTLAYLGEVYGIFDGFVVFLTYNITNDIPSGKYECYVVIGPDNDKSEKYSQILYIE